MISSQKLLEVACRARDAAMALGVDEVEVYASATDELEVAIQKDDIHLAQSAEETTLGIRVFDEGRIGFATVNGEERIDKACEEAVALARASRADPQNRLDAVRTLADRRPTIDPAVASLEIEDLVLLSRGLIDSVKSKDERVRIDSGSVSRELSARAIATSKGIEAHDASASAGGGLFGMAVDGDEVGSFDYDSHVVARRSELEAELRGVVDRFVTNTTGALGAGQGESFRGTAILSPEVVGEFILGDLLSVLSGTAVRTGKSPFKERLGDTIATSSFSLRDDPQIEGSPYNAWFDREGTPCVARDLVENGVLRSFLYDCYEARVAGLDPSGHAWGGAASQPQISPSCLVLAPGDRPYETLVGEAERAVLVTRFSASTNPITGEFSGVVKGGFLVENGERRPIKETLIQGKLYDLLLMISGVSQETRCIGGRHRLPALRVEDLSITAG